MSPPLENANPLETTPANGGVLTDSAPQPHADDGNAETAIADTTPEFSHDFSQVSATMESSAGLVMPLPDAHVGTATVVPPPVFAPPANGSGAVGGGVLALLLVVSLILALAWLAKRMPGVGSVTAANPALRVVGSLALGPRERLVVVEVGQTQLLISVGAGGTRALHTLAEPLPAADAAPSPFASLLAQHFGKKP